MARLGSIIETTAAVLSVAIPLAMGGAVAYGFLKLLNGMAIAMGAGY